MGVSSPAPRSRCENCHSCPKRKCQPCVVIEDLAGKVRVRRNSVPMLCKIMCTYHLKSSVIKGLQIFQAN